MRAISDDRWPHAPRRRKPGKFSDRALLGPRPPWPTTPLGWLEMFSGPVTNATAFCVVLYFKGRFYMWLFHFKDAADRAGLLWHPHVPQIAEMLGMIQ